MWARGEEKGEYYHDCTIFSHQIACPLEALSWHSVHTFNISLHSNEWYDEQMVKIRTEIDDVKRNKMVKDLSVWLMNEATTIPLWPSVAVAAWWPWLQNYYGEVSCARNNRYVFMSYIWIDEVLKAEMGY
ncbi:hypothetical protein ES705_45690 [subsurface metagenome]